MGTEDEFREFVTTRWNALVRSAYLLTGDRGHAEDLVQNALERMHRRWRTVEDPERYVRRILVTQASARWRRRARRPELLTGSIPDVAGLDAFSRRDDRDELWRALQEVPPRTRAVLVLRYFEDLSEAECAAVLGCSVGSVKSQASRGLATLRARADAAHTASPSAAASAPVPSPAAVPAPAPAGAVEPEPFPGHGPSVRRAR